MLLGELLTCYRARVAFVEHSEVPERLISSHSRSLEAFRFVRIPVPSLHRASVDALIYI